MQWTTFYEFLNKGEVKWDDCTVKSWDSEDTPVFIMDPATFSLIQCEKYAHEEEIIKQ